MIALNLIVLRVPDIERTCEFLKLLGVDFSEGKHSHGKGPEHYSTELNGVLLEIYPLSKGCAPCSLRIGLEVESLDRVLEGLCKTSVKISHGPWQSEFGYRAVIEGPDGLKVELKQRGT